MTEKTSRKPIKLAWKILLDVVMCLLLVLLYKAKVLTLTYHEVVGIGILVIFLVHCLFNKAWIVKSTKRLFSPDLPTRTKVSYWLSVALIVCFLIIIISGLFISKVLFREFFESLGMDSHNQVAQTLHLFFSAVSLILVGAHVGLYWDIVKGFFKKKLNLAASVAKPLSYVALAVVLAFGVYSVPTSGFASWLACPVIPISHDHGDHGDHGDDVEAPEDAEAETERAGESTGRPADADAEAGAGEPTGRPAADAEATDTESGRGSEGGSESNEGRGGQGGEAPEGGSDSEGGERNNHGTNVTFGGTLLVIAQFTSIIGLFATITYWIDRALKKRKKAARSK